MTTPAIVVEKVSRSFAGKPALVEVDLAVERGEVRALLGPNGAGKTTLLRTIVGSVRPNTGQIRVLGVPWRDLSRRNSRALFGLVTSGDRSCYHRLSGLENLIFFARLHGLSRPAAKTRAMEILEWVGLTEAAGRRAGTYSHGMQKRLSVARALLMDPPILLVDEATHDLDPAGARQIRRLLKEAALRGTGVLWATQRIDEIQDTAATVTVLDRGHVRFDGTLEELARSSGSRRYRLELAQPLPRETHQTHSLLSRVRFLTQGVYSFDLPAGMTLGEAISTLGVLGLEVTGCRLERSEFEDAFLSLTTGTIE